MHATDYRPALADWNLKTCRKRPAKSLCSSTQLFFVRNFSLLSAATAAAAAVALFSRWIGIELNDVPMTAEFSWRVGAVLPHETAPTRRWFSDPHDLPPFNRNTLQLINESWLSIVLSSVFSKLLMRCLDRNYHHSLIIKRRGIFKENTGPQDKCLALGLKMWPQSQPSRYPIDSHEPRFRVQFAV